MLDRIYPTPPALTDHVAWQSEAGTYPSELLEVFSDTRFQAAYDEISGWPGYEATPLRSLDKLAAALGIYSVHYKDESGRFGLGSFKALGGAYAVMRLVADQGTTDLTVTSATDGNHGRSVAWGAQRAGCRARIYIHRDVSVGRQQAMEALGAEVVRTAGDYDDSVRVCARESAERGWHVVSDTSYPGYDLIPRDVMAGYGVMASEILDQLDTPPSHVILQAGVGGMAAAITARLWLALGEKRPRFIMVEADRAPCILATARAGTMQTVTISEETLMAGLSCGEASPLAWEILRRCADHFVTVGDDYVAPTMRALANGEFGGGAIEGGECATPGLVTLIAAAAQDDLRAAFGLDEDSRVLVIGSEGATDPEIYQALLDGP